MGSLACAKTWTCAVGVCVAIVVSIVASTGHRASEQPVAMLTGGEGMPDPPTADAVTAIPASRALPLSLLDILLAARNTLPSVYKDVLPPRYPVICSNRSQPLLSTLKLIAGSGNSGSGPTVAEIGVFVGNFSTQIIEHLSPARLYLLDLWGCTSGCGKSDEKGATHHNRARARDGRLTGLRQVYRPGNKEVVAAKFAPEVASGKISLHQGPSQVTIPQLAERSLDVAYLDTLHDYTLTATELRALALKVAPGGLLCGHDYTHAAGSRYYEERPFAERGEAIVTYGVIEAVNEFLLYHPDWFFALRTSLADQGQHTSFCLSRWKHFPHEKYREVQSSCEEKDTHEAYLQAKGHEDDWTYEGMMRWMYKG